MLERTLTLISVLSKYCSLLILQSVGNGTMKNRLKLIHADCTTRGWLRRLRLNPGNKVHRDKVYLRNQPKLANQIKDLL